MRFPSDNKGEMFKSSVTDQGIERLLTGSDPEDSELMALVPFVSMLRSSGAWFPSESSVQRFAAEASAIALASLESTTEPTASGMSAQKPRTLLTPRLAGALAALLVFFGMTGVAVASNDAAPGDALYGLDRALERMGIGAGRAEERIEEANQLLAQGRAQEALGHVTEAFDEAEEEGEDVTELAEARRALEAAATRLPDAETNASATVDEDVEALLRYIRENVEKDVGEDGREFGQRVAALARLIAVNEEGGQTTDDAATTSTTDDRGNGNGNENENENRGGNGNNGNGGGNNDGGGGPPDDSPSETAPGQEKKP